MHRQSKVAVVMTKHTMSFRNSRPKQHGFSLLEVLIAVLVLSIGLLGLAGLQATSLRYNHDAQLRGQASLLAYDMADRLRANRDAAVAGNYDGTHTATACQDNFTPAGGAVAARDLDEWRQSLGCLLPDAQGVVSRNGDMATITIQWVEDRSVDDPTAARQTFSFTSRLR